MHIIPLHRLGTDKEGEPTTLLWPHEHHHKPQRSRGMAFEDRSNDIGLSEPASFRPFLPGIRNRRQETEIYGRNGVLFQKEEGTPQRVPHTLTATEL